MFLVLSCMLAAVAAAPSYDQRQEGETNVLADIQNIVIVLALPSKTANGIFDGFLKRSKQKSNENIQDRSEVQLIEAFVKPSKPYGVEITPVADGGIEVMIPGQRRFEIDVQPEKDDLKPISPEPCAPGLERDPENVCKDALLATQSDKVLATS